MEYYQLYPHEPRKTIEELPVPFSDDSGFLVCASTLNGSDFVNLQKVLLKEVRSDWPPSWNGVVDQFCFLSIVEKWSSIELVLAVSDETPLQPILDLIEVLSAIDRFHEHLSVRLSVWTKYG